MKKKILLLISTILLLSFNGMKAQSTCKGKLIFEDNFDGTSLNTSKWSYELGNGCPSLCGWGNNEKEYYTNSTQNVNVSGGYLNLIARYQPNYNGSGSDFTSGKINTKNKFDRTYGRFEARIKLPAGLGLWPAFWMLPTDNAYGGWPTSGEIDIMENRGNEPTKAASTLHYGNGWPGNLWDSNEYTLTDGSTFFNSFHTFAVEWQPGVLKFYIDDILIKTETKNPYTISPASNNAVQWPWDKNFYMILNLALGGGYVGNPSTQDIINNASFPATMQVDYVRVYDMNSTPFSSAYSGTAIAIPGKIEAENYNIGCGGLNYYDTDNINQGNAYRKDGVDIEACTDANGGFNVGYIQSGEWLEYDVNIAQSGNYDIYLRVAADNANGKVNVLIDNQNISGSIGTPNTGGWQNWQTVKIANKNINAGNRKLKIYIENGGFNLNYIEFKKITNIQINNINKTYGDGSFQLSPNSNSNQSFTYSISSGNSVSINSSGLVNIIGTGNTTIQISQNENQNFSAATTSVIINVAKKNLNITAENKSKNYLDPNPTLTMTFNGFVYGQSSSNITIPSISTAASNNSTPGNYPITLSGGSAANYNLVLINGSLSINKITPTINIGNVTKTYGDANFNLSYTSNSTGNANYSINSGSAIGITSAGLVNIVGTGTSKINLTIAETNTYTSKTVTIDILVNKKDLIITAENKSKNYLSNNPTLTMTYSGFVYGQNETNINKPAITTTASNNSLPGIYPINLTGGSATNYNLILKNGSLTITKAVPTITLNNVTKTYGDGDFTIPFTSNSNGAVTFNISTGNSIMLSANGLASIKESGTTKVIVSIAETETHLAKTASCDVVINKKKLVITAENKSKKYLNSNPSFTLKYDGFVNGDTYLNIVSPTITTNADNISLPGIYTITLNGGTASNYSLQLVNGTLTVEKIEPTFKYTGATTVSLGETVGISYESNHNGSPTYSISNTNASISTDQITGINQGTFDLSITLPETNIYLEKTYIIAMEVKENNQTTNTYHKKETLIKIFPTITNGTLHIEGINAPSEVMVVNAQGMSVYQTILYRNETINLNSLSKGSYSIIITNRNDTQYSKIILE